MEKCFLLFNALVLIVHECPNSDLKSPIGYKGINGKWYKAYKHKMHFYDALEVCHSHNSTLVEFRTMEDMAALEELRGMIDIFLVIIYIESLICRLSRT